MQRTDTSLDQYNDEAWAQYAAEQAAAPPSGDGDLAYMPALPTAYPDARFPAWDVRGTPMCPAPGEPPLDRPRGFFVVETAEGSNANAACIHAPPGLFGFSYSR